MSWRERLVRAELRGFEFLTDSHDTKGGRRLVVHEYPGGDVPAVEDLGEKAGEWNLNAYFIGPDYDLERNGFLGILNQPGATWLMHPWLGRIWVRVRDWSAHESNRDGGMCTVSVHFVPGGSSIQPISDRVDIAIDRVIKFKQVVQDKFALEPMSAASMTSMIASVQGQLDRVRSLISLATLPLTLANQARGVIDGIKGDAAALMAVPAQYAAAMRSFSNLLGSGDAAGNSASSTGYSSSGVSDTALPQVVDSLVSMTKLPAPVPGGAGDSPALRVNLRREDDCRRRLMLAGAAQAALADYRSAEDRDAALASVLQAMDRMLPDMSDEVFEAALDCRATLIDALLAQDLEPAQVRDIVSPLPATVLAHRMEVDEAVFLVRNKVRHPLFVRGRVRG
ncbi:DNA circularization N-terminal domain-containing protein [Candidatus Ferrigenium straubiae]|uniref:DNA circularization N-terminal domain-containing protein n=1 Tax=Candidatus Ferrigenium straubiae TaxID=2919506 RepID=UPI003F4A9A03